MPPKATAPETMKAATFCQKLNLTGLKARPNVMITSQPEHISMVLLILSTISISYFTSAFSYSESVPRHDRLIRPLGLINLAVIRPYGLIKKRGK